MSYPPFLKVIECNIRNVDFQERNVTVPFFEEVLEEKLQKRRVQCSLKDVSHSREAGISFLDYYVWLLEFREENGHVNSEF